MTGRSDAFWGLACIAASLVIGVALWGIADTGFFEGTPLAVFDNLWLTLGFTSAVGALIIAPRVGGDDSNKREK